MNLFDAPPVADSDAPRPLAERMRPRTLDEYIGQQHLLADGKPLRLQIERDDVTSMILWGPPGVGKTTLARIIAHATQAHFVTFSAVLASIKEVKAVMADAQRAHRSGQRTIVFVDEVHRFNKAQQDAFLPYVESGDITFIGATTENPSFEVISALLSRVRVYILEALAPDEMLSLLRNAVADTERGLGDRNLTATDDTLRKIANFSDGDARAALQLLDTAARAADSTITPELLEATVQRKLPRHDKTGEEHYNLMSALHKSIRSSDPDATLYWLARMLEGGEDRLYIGRRLVRAAYEDIGLADPRAAEIAQTAIESFRLVGEPEGDLFLAQAAVYLAIAPKSDSVYSALKKIRRDVQQTQNEPVPLQVRNAPTRSMKEWGYGKGYEHAHEQDDGIPGLVCLPDSLKDKTWYEPTTRGTEAKIESRLKEIRRLRKQRRPT